MAFCIDLWRHLDLTTKIFWLNICYQTPIENMKKLIALLTLGILVSTQLLAGPGKKNHRTDNNQQMHELAVPAFEMEDESFLIGISPIEEEKAIALQEEESRTTTSAADIQERPAMTDRQLKRLDKVEHRLNKRIRKLEKKPNATLWNSEGNRWLIIAAVVGIAALLISVLAFIVPPLYIIAYLAWIAAVVLALVGLVIGLGGI
jgi:hypothetical protein